MSCFKSTFQLHSGLIRALLGKSIGINFCARFEFSGRWTTNGEDRYWVALKKMTFLPMHKILFCKCAKARLIRSDVCSLAAPTVHWWALTSFDTDRQNEKMRMLNEAVYHWTGKVLEAFVSLKPTFEPMNFWIFSFGSEFLFQTTSITGEKHRFIICINQILESVLNMNFGLRTSLKTRFQQKIVTLCICKNWFDG